MFDKISDNTLEIKVANQAKFQLPATGSWSRLILGFTGAIIAGTAVIMYLLLQKRRKEAKLPDCLKKQTDDSIYDTRV